MLRVMLQNMRPATRRAPQTLRPFSQSADKNSTTPAEASPSPKPNLTSYTTVTNFDKRVLVWTGKYKTVAEVPASVGPDILNRARDKFRVKVCNYMLVGTVISCIVMIFIGKRAAKRGESVIKMNADWHREYNVAADEKERKEKAGA